MKSAAPHTIRHAVLESIKEAPDCFSSTYIAQKVSEIVGKEVKAQRIKHYLCAIAQTGLIDRVLVNEAGHSSKVYRFKKQGVNDD